MFGSQSTASGATNAAALPQQTSPEGQPSKTIWGGWGQGVNSALGGALNLYGQYEQIQAMKNSAGVAREEQTKVNELENGAAVVVDAPKTQATSVKAQEVMVFGFPQKQVLIAFGGLLAVGILLKVAKS